MKLFTAGRVCIAIIILVFFTFLWAGSETLLTNLGVETKTTLVKNNQILKEQVDRLTTINEDNSKELARLKLQYEREAKAVREMEQKKKQIEETSTAAVDTHKKAIAKVKLKVTEKKVVTATEIILPRAEIDAISELNITFIHDTYDMYFPKE